MSKILITGGTGLIGSYLTKKLEKGGHEVAILSRTPQGKNQYKWDISTSFIDPNALKNTDYIIHLAGAGIADKRWTSTRKKILIDSRVASANLLFNKVKEFRIPIKGFISASGIGYYGARTIPQVFHEDDAPSNDFISQICIAWEDAAHQFRSLDIPVIILRTGVVLSDEGGALNRINTPLVLAPLGSGKQFMPWIHLEDLSNLYVNAVQFNYMDGIYNAVGPEHQSNRSFTKTLGKATNKPVLPFSIPSILLKIPFGDMANILLKGSKVSSEKTAHDYRFIYATLEEALTSIYKT